MKGEYGQCRICCLPLDHDKIAAQLHCDIFLCARCIPVFDELRTLPQTIKELKQRVSDLEKVNEA